MLLNLFASFQPSAGTASIDSVTVVEDFVVCGEDMFAVAVDPTLATRAGDVVTFAGGVDVTGVTIDEVIADGKTWCVR